MAINFGRPQVMSVTILRNWHVGIGILTMNKSDDMIWVLLRGLTREYRHWEKFPKTLKSALPHATIILPDLPGSGIHHKEICPSNIKDILEFVRADIAVHLFNKPVHILGLSMGAMVAIEWMQRYPQECAGAVLMNTSLKDLNPFYQRLRPHNYVSLIYHLFFNHSVQLRENAIFNLTCNLNSERDSVINNWVRYANEHPVSKLNALRQLIAASRYKIPRHKPETPILLLRGLGDRLVNPQCSQILANHWELELQSHASAGHDLTLDDAAWVCQKIIEWLEQPDLNWPGTV